MSSPQEYWDACLIRTWRNFGTLSDANKMFHSIVGKWPEEVEPILLRVPISFVPYTSQARYFVAHFMPKLNDMLINSDREKDVVILRKLKDSKYTASGKTHLSDEERERKNESKKYRNARERIELDVKNYSERNNATDWGTVKGRVKIGRYK